MNEQSILIKYGQILRERIRKMENRQKQNRRIMEFYETQSIVNFCAIFKEALHAVNLVKPKNGRVHAKTKRTDFLERMMGDRIC
jgi:hypothetical protein